MQERIRYSVLFIHFFFFQNYYYSSDFIDLYGHMLNFKPFEKCFFISKR